MSGKRVKQGRAMLRKEYIANLEKLGIKTDSLKDVTLTDLDILLKNAESGLVSTDMSAEEVRKAVDILRGENATDLTKKRDSEIIPVVREIIKALADEPNLALGSQGALDAEEASKCYIELYKRVVVPILVKYDVKVLDLEYLFEVCQQPFMLLSQVTLATVKQARDMSEAKHYGLKTNRDIRISHIQDSLQGTLAKGDEVV